MDKDFIIKWRDETPDKKGHVHEYRELSEDECFKHIPRIIHFGNCYHVYLCKCGHIRHIDSSG